MKPIFKLTEPQETYSETFRNKSNYNWSVTLTNITNEIGFLSHLLSLKNQFFIWHKELPTAAALVGATLFQRCHKDGMWNCSEQSKNELWLKIEIESSANHHVSQCFHFCENRQPRLILRCIKETQQLFIMFASSYFKKWSTLGRLLIWDAIKNILFVHEQLCAWSRCKP